LSGWWFDIASGDMYAYRPASHTFAVIDRRLAEQLIGRD
jgi:carbonic anhydrase